MTVFPIAGRLPARFALFASAVLLGAACLHAFSVLRGAPATPSASAAAPAPPPPADPAALHLFGRNVAAPVNAEAPPPPNLALIGVIAPTSGHAAVALMQVDGKPQALRPGDEAAPGWVLREVLRDRVVLEQGGQRSEVLLPSARATTGLAGTGPMSALAVPAGLHGPAGPAAPFRLDVQSLGPNHFGFSKSELSRALQDPRQAASLGRATPANGGGLAVDSVPPGSLAERIGLHAGDVLKSANSQTLNNLTDLPRLYQEFGSAAEVRLEINRSGQPTILQYTVRP